MSNKRMEISNPEHTAAGGPKRHNASRWNRVRIGFWISWIVASLISITLGLQGLGILAFWRTSHKGHLTTSPEWDLTNSVCFAFVLYTILSVITTHKIDEWRDGWGIRDAYKTLRRPTMATEPDITLAIIARQSIHVAIALGLLVAIFQGHFLNPEGKVSSISDALSQFNICVAWIIAGGFSLSVVLILVSALCYDYSCRFNWKDPLKRSLMRKGLKLDIWSWYAFTLSLILSIALVSPFLCILINACYGFLLLYYYFFTDAKSIEEIQRTSALSPDPPSAAIDS